MDFRLPPIYSWVSPKEFQVRLFKLSRCLIYKVQKSLRRSRFRPGAPAFLSSFASSVSLFSIPHLVRFVKNFFNFFRSFSGFRIRFAVLFELFSGLVVQPGDLFRIPHPAFLVNNFFKFFASALPAGFLFRRSFEAAYTEYTRVPHLSTLSAQILEI